MSERDDQKPVELWQLTSLIHAGNAAAWLVNRLRELELQEEAVMALKANQLIGTVLEAHGVRRATTSE